MVFRVPEARIRERMVIGKHLAPIIGVKSGEGQCSRPTLIFSHEHATLAFIFHAIFLQTHYQLPNIALCIYHQTSRLLAFHILEKVWFYQVRTPL